jgi:DNA-binding GntR family transcriptional regulator
MSVGPPSSRELLSDSVRRRLLTAILDGTLTPGERLHDDELVGWLEVSRTPIRTALERLAEAGLIEMEPNRFTRVALPTRADLIDARNVYGSLLTALVAEVVPRLAASDLFELESLGARRAPPLAFGDAFEFFAHRSGNAVLLTALAEVELRLEFFFRAVGFDDEAAASGNGGDVGEVAMKILRGAREGGTEAIVSALIALLAVRATSSSRAVR